LRRLLFQDPMTTSTQQKIIQVSGAVGMEGLT